MIHCCHFKALMIFLMSLPIIGAALYWLRHHIKNIVSRSRNSLKRSDHHEKNGRLK